MADDIDQAANAFDAAMRAEAPRPSRKTSDTGAGPQESVFRNVGDFAENSEAKGGGDDDPEDLIYGKTVQDKGSKADSRDPRKRDSEDSEGDNDESDGDDSEREEDDSGDDPDAGSESDEDPDVSADGKGEETLLARKVEVTVDGEPVEVSVKEALEGYVRTETFHRRMNQLDEAKKIVRRAAADAVHNYEYSVTLAKEMEAHMDTMIPKEPNWDEEFQKDPAKARELQRYYEKATEFRKSLRDQMAQVNKKQAELNQAQLQAFAEEETSKFERMNQKNWSDPKKKIKDLQSMRKTGLSSGFTEEELSQVYDSRMLNVLLKASKYDRMMASKPKPVVQTRDKPVPSGAGSAKQRTAHKGVSTAMNRLNRTGSIDDAAVVFDQLLRRG